tara:strand:- start:8 stop:214 length:207 start_codon:yes stop_codon:yes gene_type:complete
MGKVKNYMMDIEEKVFDIDGLENKIGECEHIAEMKAFVVEKLGLTTHFDIGIAEGVVDDMWNDFWGYY